MIYCRILHDFNGSQLVGHMEVLRVGVCRTWGSCRPISRGNHEPFSWVEHSRACHTSVWPRGHQWPRPLPLNGYESCPSCGPTPCKWLLVRGSIDGQPSQTASTEERGKDDSHLAMLGALLPPFPPSRLCSKAAADTRTAGSPEGARILFLESFFFFREPALFCRACLKSQFARNRDFVIFVATAI